MRYVKMNVDFLVQISDDMTEDEVSCLFLEMKTEDIKVYRSEKLNIRANAITDFETRSKFSRKGPRYIVNAKVKAFDLIDINE